MDYNILVIGNPGVGKSTLLNCVMHSRYRGLSVNEFFKSGVNLGGGLTFGLDCKRIGNVTFMDTPGIEDHNMRQLAARSVTEALQKNGSYKVIFVVTLESGRVRTMDMATINLIISNAPEITNFGLIFNKLSEILYVKLQNQFEMNKLMESVMLQLCEEDECCDEIKKDKPIPYPLFIPIIYGLNDFDNQTASIPELDNFMNNVLPSVQIHKERVKEIQGNALEKLVKQLEKNFQELKQNTNKLQSQVANVNDILQTHLVDLIEKETKRHDDDIKELREELIEERRIAKERDKDYLENIKKENQQILIKELEEAKMQIKKETEDELKEMKERLKDAETKFKQWNDQIKAKEKENTWFSFFLNFIY